VSAKDANAYIQDYLDRQMAREAKAADQAVEADQAETH